MLCGVLSGWGKIVKIGGSNSNIRISDYPDSRLRGELDVGTLEERRGGLWWAGCSCSESTAFLAGLLSELLWGCGMATMASRRAARRGSMGRSRRGRGASGGGASSVAGERGSMTEKRNLYVCMYVLKPTAYC